MTAEIATLEKVGLAADELRRQGKKVTANSVIAEIGGGSKPTVLKHLQSLRQQQEKQDETVPASVYDLARPILAQIFAEGIKAEEARQHERSERFHRVMNELEAEIDELSEAAEAQEQVVAELQGKLAETLASLEAANVKVAQQDDHIIRLQAEIARQNLEASTQFSTLVESFSRQIAELTARLERPDAGQEAKAPSTSGRRQTPKSGKGK